MVEIPCDSANFNLMSDLYFFDSERRPDLEASTNCPSGVLRFFPHALDVQT